MPPPPPRNNTTSHFDPYAVLNVPRDASREEIKAAFLRFARVLHPDKKQVSDRDGGDELFGEVDRAWKILGQDETRAVFDEMGEEGVRMQQQFQMVTQRRVGPREVATLMQSVRRMEKENSASAKTYIRAETTLESLREFVELLLDRPAFATIPFVRALSAQHVVEYSIDKSTSLAITTVIGNRAAAAAASQRRDDDDDDNNLDIDDDTLQRGERFILQSVGSLTAEIVHMSGGDTFRFRLGGASVGTSFEFSVAVQRSFLHSKTQVEFVGGPSAKDAALDFSLTQTLSDSLEGSWRLGFGERAGMGWSLHHTSTISPRAHEDDNDDDEDAEATGARAMGHHAAVRSRVIEGKCDVSPFVGFGVALSWLESLTPSQKLRTSLNVGAAATELEIETIHVSYLTDSLRSIAVSIGLSGVYLKIRLGEGGKRFEFPIRVTATPSITHAFYTGLVPALFQYMFMAFWRPFETKQRQAEQDELKLELQHARERAVKQANLMKPIAEMRRKEQLLLSVSGNGLIVLKATYGREGDEGTDNNNDDNILPTQLDVTVQLNFFITADGMLHLRPGGKSNLMGFYNPIPSTITPPRLFVRYAFAQRVYEVSYEDEEEVNLPADPRAVLIGTTLDPVNWSA